MDSNSKISEAISWGVSELLETSQSPQLDAELLLANALDFTKIELISKNNHLLGVSYSRYIDLIKRRKAHEPVAYIIGKKEFWGLDFIVSPDVLVPRPETELLVEWAVEEMEARRDKCLRVLDCGTGSGCVVISLAVEARRRGIDVVFYALDISEAALRIAKQNALFQQVEINFLSSNWYSNIPAGLRFELIVSNPPYVAVGEQVSPETKLEPQNALFAGSNGLDSIERLITEREKFLTTDGALLLEVGHQHWRSLAGEFRPDIYGIKRVVKIK